MEVDSESADALDSAATVIAAAVDSDGAPASDVVTAIVVAPASPSLLRTISSVQHSTVASAASVDAVVPASPSLLRTFSSVRHKLLKRIIYLFN